MEGNSAASLRNGTGSPPSAAISLLMMPVFGFKNAMSMPHMTTVEIK